MENKYVQHEMQRTRPLVVVREYVLIGLALLPFAMIVKSVRAGE